MEYKINHIPIDTPHNRRPQLPMKPEYITIHSTGNPNSNAEGERGWLTNPRNNRTASYHIVVDDKQAIECLPLDEVSWNAGDGYNGTGNRKSISIEICESGDRIKTIQNAIKLVSKLLKERGWGIDRLKRHFDWSGKICPRIMAKDNWDNWNGFVNEVKKEINGKEMDPLSSWAKEGYEFVKENNISDGKRPKANVTREEVWQMIFNYHRRFGNENIK